MVSALNIWTKATLWLCWATTSAMATQSATEWEPEWVFEGQVSKHQIYQGERVAYEFVLYSRALRLEVEVVKFPEFRGFWSENTALRQGPLILQSAPDRPGWNKVWVGVYELMPMVGVEKPTIVPMQIVIRPLGFGREAEEQLPNTAPPLTVRPLPPAPPQLKQRFKGAVGQFTLGTAANRIGYFPGEPTMITYLLSGQGNFAEINSLGITPPEGITALSERATLMGQPAYQTKSFEWVGTVSWEQGGVWPELAFVYFNPRTERYQITTAPALELVAQQRPVLPPAEIDWGPPKPHWSRYDGSLLRWLWALFLLSFASLIAIRATQTLRERAARNPLKALRRKWRDWTPPEQAEPLMVQSNALLLETVCLLAGRHFRTSDQAVDFVRARWGEQAAEPLAQQFQWLDALRYSPNPPKEPDPGEWTCQVANLRKLLLT